MKLLHLYLYYVIIFHFILFRSEVGIEVGIEIGIGIGIEK
jgi:hypothetical protein